MARDEQYEKDKREMDRAINYGMSRGLKVSLVFLAVCLVLGGGWFLKVALSDVKGRGDSVVKINDADNRLFQQGNFNDRYQGILAADKDIEAAYQAKKASPDDRTLEINYTGVIQHCNDLVGQYNSLARKIIAKKFKDFDLPSQIDDADSTTDCKENSR